MKRAVIILNGECRSFEYLKELCKTADFVICADGGYKYAKETGINVNLVLGDFDSCDIPGNVEILEFPPEKDFSDGELAVSTAKNKGFEEIILTCALGGRQDHTLSNLMLLDENVCIYEKNEKIYFVSKEKLLLEKEGTVFSIVPTAPSVISIKGAKYPLENKEIKWGSSLTLSNETTEKETKIEVKEGKILLFVNN